MSLSSVDLPAPFLPTIPKTEPAGTARLTSRTARTVPREKDLERLLVSMAFMGPPILELSQDYPAGMGKPFRDLQDFDKECERGGRARGTATFAQRYAESLKPMPQTVWR